jgi:hypothetical protein
MSDPLEVTTAPTPGTRTWTFDPVAVGRRECDAWVAYYRRDWVPFLRHAVRLVAEGFGMSRLRTLQGAWYVLRANQVWAPYPDNDPDQARDLMRRFYALVRADLHVPIDPVRAAELEVGWWHVHRLHQHGDPISAEELTDALSALYAYVYGVSSASVRHGADLRREAMDVSDTWVEAGCDPADPAVGRERRLLVASYSALREALDRAAGSGRPSRH